MGHYTRFTFKGKPKAEHAIIFEKVLKANQWAEVKEVKDAPDLAKWLEVYRADFIPFGGNMFIPESEYVRPYIDGEGCLIFDCSLKNYEGEIKEWLHIFGPLFESAAYSTHYEEDEDPRHYTLP